MPVIEAPPKPPLEQRAQDRELPQDPAELHLLIEELEDERERSRWRESVWISIIIHLLLVMAIVLQPKFFPELFSAKDKVVLVTPDMQDKDIRFLALPQDQQKSVAAPKTNILSDKNRIAQARRPTLDRHTLEELQNARRPNPPGMKAMPAPQQPPQQSAAAAAPQPTQQAQQQAAEKPPDNSNMQAKLEPPPEEHPINRNVFSTGQSVGSAIQQAARAAAAGRSGGGGE
jgi:hypothetical protein